MPVSQALHYLTPLVEPALCPSLLNGTASAPQSPRSLLVFSIALAQEPPCQAVQLPSQLQFIPLDHFVLLYTRLAFFQASTYLYLAIPYQVRKIDQSKS